MNSVSPSPSASRAVSVTVILLLALAVHGPLLLMQLPANSYDAYTHMFMASHYAGHWFNPWNEKWFAGFSQTTYPPLAHQLIALFSYLFGLTMSYMFVQLVAILLIAVGILRYARLWVDEQSASYAALGAVFLGSLGMLTYQSGQINTILGSALTLNAIPYFYRWLRSNTLSNLVKGVLLTMSAAAVHHITLISIVLFAAPVVWLALVDRNQEGAEASAPGVISRALAFGALVGIGIALVLLPFWISFFKNPVTQLPIPHPSRDNYLLNLKTGLNYWLIPYGALALVVPYMFLRGATSRRLRPLFVGWWVTFLIGLGGTTPFAKLLFNRFFYVFTYERFTFVSTLMVLPLAGLLAAHLINRYGRKALVGVFAAMVATFATSVAWMQFNPIGDTSFKVDQVIAFMNRDDHSKFRYLTLGFGSLFSKVSIEVNASTVDGDYNSARLLPEMTQYGAGKLDNAKYYGLGGMESLRAMLKHANQYGLKYIFVRDRFYEPLLAFAGWRTAEQYDNGNVTLWVKDDVPPAQKMDFGAPPPPWQGLIWGLLPISVALLSLLSVVLLHERRRLAETYEFPATDEAVALREAK
ncbi:MAG TPA: hypothetical protein VN577_13355 [Terriglobales bacterium]|nr:hypothetical protein [Terriglobales bacterium]